MKRKQTAYQKNLSRLFRQIGRMEKRGYRFDDNIREELKGKTARQLGQLKTKWLYKQSEYIDYKTGKIMSGESGRSQELKEKAKRSAQTRRRRNLPDYDDTILSNFEADFESWLNAPAETTQERVAKGGKISHVARNPKAVEAEESAKTMIRAIYDRALKEDRHGLAVRIDLNSDKIFDIIIRKMPSSDAERIRQGGHEIAEIIKGSYVGIVERTGIEEDFEEYDEDYEE